MKWLAHWRIRNTHSHHPIPHEAWKKLMHEADIFRGLSAVEQAHLRELTTLFMHRKRFSGVQGMIVSTDIALAVAAQACLLMSLRIP
jgi:Mlc titration factor MtfA (ptsG expression regulator)